MAESNFRVPALRWLSQKLSTTQTLFQARKLWMKRVLKSFFRFFLTPTTPQAKATLKKFAMQDEKWHKSPDGKVIFVIFYFAAAAAKNWNEAKQKLE